MSWRQNSTGSHANTRTSEHLDYHFTTDYRVLREKLCRCMVCCRLTGGAVGAKPASWTQTHSCYMVTLTTIQACTLPLTFQTMESLGTGWRDTHICISSVLFIIELWHLFYLFLTLSQGCFLLHFSQYVPIQPGRQVQAPPTESHSPPFSHWHWWWQPGPK